MTIIEALTLARDKPGTKVRPVCWQSQLYVVVVEIKPGHFSLFDDEGYYAVVGLDEILGHWEVIE